MKYVQTGEIILNFFCRNYAPFLIVLAPACGALVTFIEGVFVGINVKVLLLDLLDSVISLSYKIINFVVPLHFIYFCLRFFFFFFFYVPCEIGLEHPICIISIAF